jgi:hypothetical protein
MKFSLIVITLFSSTFLFSQNQKLVEDFLGSHYDKIKNSNPQMISYYENILDHGYEILEEENITDINIKDFPEVFYKNSNGEIKLVNNNEFIDSLEKPNFNYLKYTFPREADNQYYRIDSTRVILIRSSNSIINLNK